MSVGHFCYENLVSLKPELHRAMSNNAVRQFIVGEKFTVSRKFDIPYLAGYSEDGRMIYVDRHLPVSLKVGPTLAHILPYIILHERTEKALIDIFGLKYPEAHRIATCAEHNKLTKAGFSPKLYERALNPYIKADEHEKIELTPPDLDLTPYRDSRDLRLIARIKAKMKG